MVKTHIMNLLSQRDYTVSELARLLKISEPSLLQYLIFLQKDKQPIVIEKGNVTLDKGTDFWPFVAGVFGLATLILAVLL